MAKSPPFVGRRQELQSFDELLRSQSGQAIIVVGPRGMGKTLLVNRMARCARDRRDLQCGAVRYEVTPADTVSTTMSLMMENAFEAADVKEKSFDATPRRRMNKLGASGTHLHGSENARKHLGATK